MAGANVAVTISVIICTHDRPDGLDRVAEDAGFLESGREGHGPMADYQMPGVAGEGRSTALAGAAGTLIALGAGLIAGNLILRRRTPRGGGVAK